MSKYVHLRRLHAAVWQLAYRPDVSVLTIALHAGYESPEAFARAFKRRTHKLARDKHATFNLVYDNPHTTEPDAYRMDLCCAVSQPVEPNADGVVEKRIPAGRCARIRCVGGDDALESCLAHLYGEWLPGSGERERDFPLFFQRIAFFPDVPDHETITDIFLPLQDAAPQP